MIRHLVRRLVWVIQAMKTVQASALASSIGWQCLCWGYQRALRIEDRTQPNPIAAYALGEGTKPDPIIAIVLEGSLHPIFLDVFIHPIVLDVFIHQYFVCPFLLDD
jgi:hypothetical protein